MIIAPKSVAKLYAKVWPELPAQARKDIGNKLITFNLKAMTLAFRMREHEQIKEIFNLFIHLPLCSKSRKRDEFRFLV